MVPLGNVRECITVILLLLLLLLYTYLVRARSFSQHKLLRVLELVKVAFRITPHKREIIPVTCTCYLYLLPVPVTCYLLPVPVT